MGVALFTSTAGLIIFWAAHWKVDDLQRQAIMEALKDSATLIEEKDRLLENFRTEQEADRRAIEGVRARCGRLEDEIVALSGERIRLRRYVKRLCTQMQQAGVTPVPDGD